VKKIFFPIICLAVALFIFAFLWKVPEWQIASKIASSKRPPTIQEVRDRIELQRSIRITLVYILGSVFFLITVYFTWRRLTVTQEGQITERLTRAIDQIGEKKHLKAKVDPELMEQIKKNHPHLLEKPKPDK